MPLYDFACSACEARWEAVTPAGEVPEACPACGAADVRRIYTAPATHSLGLRGVAAQRSNAQRAAREERRREGWAAKDERRRRGG